MKQLLKSGIISILLLCACNNPQGASIPAGKMAKILYDVHLAEVYSANLKNDSTNKQHTGKNMDSLANYYNSIFAHYKITKEQFTQSIDWYKEHTEELDTIYTNMITELSKQDALQAGKK